jgi:hypothetical protein
MLLLLCVEHFHPGAIK